MVKPRSPSGVMELLPEQQVAFNSMLEKIRTSFESYGFLPIETPALELSEVLLTKGGGETERQVYFVQSTGSLRQGQAKPRLPEMALRFDLTVPLARYVAQYQDKLSFPFRRYQIGQVWRGERAQKGRFREFYQCDIDVVGRQSLSGVFDAEIPAVINSALTKIGLDAFTIQISNRKILRGVIEAMGDGLYQDGILRELDKMDKVGPEMVARSLAQDQFLDKEDIDLLMGMAQTRVRGIAQALEYLGNMKEGNKTFEMGKSELVELFSNMASMGVPNDRCALNFSIARGLDYYTGTVYETTLDQYPQIGSICSGGRYDNLGGQFSKTELPGVGISIGLSRLFWQLQEAGALGVAKNGVDLLATADSQDPTSLSQAFAMAQRLREAGLRVQLQPENWKISKQLSYANKAGIGFVLLRGESEMKNGTVSIKQMSTGKQVNVPLDRVVGTVKNFIDGEKAQ